MVITVEMYKQIRRLMLLGESQRQIAAKLHISRNAVKKYRDGEAVPWERKQYERPTAVVTDEVIAFIRYCLKDDELYGTKKQCHTAKRIYDRLVEEQGFAGGESTIRRTVREMKAKTVSPFVPLAFPAGDAMQVDCGEATVFIAGVKMTVNLFCARLCYSCAPIVFAYRRQNEESFLDAFVKAFQYFGGVPRRVIFDNARVAVKEGFGAHAKKQDGYAKLSAHYGFEAVFCNPASGNEKGLVEGLVGYIRRNTCVPIPNVSSLDDLNILLEQKCKTYLTHQIRGKDRKVGEMFAEEKKHLRPLPGYIFEAAKKVHARVDRYCTVRYDTNSYSVPATYCGKEVTVKALPESVQILSSGIIIAEHTRCYERQQNIYSLEHYLPLLEYKRRAIYDAQPVQKAVPAAFLEWLRAQELAPKQITELLRHCQLDGCEAVMKQSVSVSIPTPAFDIVQVQAVDLSAYDRLCTGKVGVG